MERRPGAAAPAGTFQVDKVVVQSDSNVPSAYHPLI